MRNLNGFCSGFAVVIIKCDGKCAGPYRINIGVGFHFDCAAVCIDSFAIGRKCPTCEYFTFTGKGVRFYLAFAAVNVLGIGFIRTVVGMKGKGKRRSGGEIAHINAIIAAVAGGVFLISDGYNITAFCINGKGCPVDFAAGILNKRFGAFGNVHFVTLCFGGNFVFKDKCGVACHSKLQGAACIGFSGVSALQNIFTVKSGDFPFFCARGAAGFRFCDKRQTSEKVVE